MVISGASSGGISSALLKDYAEAVVDGRRDSRAIIDAAGENAATAATGKMAAKDKANKDARLAKDLETIKAGVDFGKSAFEAVKGVVITVGVAIVGAVVGSVVPGAGTAAGAGAGAAAGASGGAAAGAGAGAGAGATAGAGAGASAGAGAGAAGGGAGAATGAGASTGVGAAGVTPGASTQAGLQSSQPATGAHVDAGSAAQSSQQARVQAEPNPAMDRAQNPAKVEPAKNDAAEKTEDTIDEGDKTETMPDFGKLADEGVKQVLDFMGERRKNDDEAAAAFDQMRARARSSRSEAYRDRATAEEELGMLRSIVG